MSNYQRVLPRDLFCEAGLLKGIGRLWILLDKTRGHNASIVEEDVPFFDIKQDPASGNIFIANLTFVIDGEDYLLERPLNSREAWPLMTMKKHDEDYEYTEVFDDEGNFSDEMKELLGL